MPHENRAYLLMPPGSAAIAVVRIVGPKVRNFLAKHFSKSVTSGRCVHGDLTDGERVIDDPVIMVVQQEPSHRVPGEGLADINLHGGPWVIRSAFDLLRREGFETYEKIELPLAHEATDGESILEREMLAHLPLARTELALRTLLAQPRAWARLRNQPDAQELRRILEDRALWWLLHAPRVAIIGVTNAGKSTLANQLFAQERSITADLPGTTRDWVGEIANIDGLAVMLVDTPGQRESDDPVEQLAIERSREPIRAADLIALVLDPTQPRNPHQTQLLEKYPQAVVVLNKCDCPALWNRDGSRAVRTIATRGAGIDELRHAIQWRFGCADLDPQRPQWWTERQRAILQRAGNDPQAMSEL